LRDQYSALFQRIPIQVSQLQSSYITQRQLTSKLADELQTLHEEHFQVKVELSSWQQRVKEADHELESLRDHLQRSERDKERLMTRLEQLRIDSDRERTQMEAELTELREQREDWQAAATATADALARAALPGDATSIEIQSLPLHQDGAHALDANEMVDHEAAKATAASLINNNNNNTATTTRDAATGTSPAPDDRRIGVDSSTSPTVPARVLHPAPTTGLDKETAARIRAHLAQGHQPPANVTLAPPLVSSSATLVRWCVLLLMHF
jgi:predicted  nucleic acid-binding Zn-ribbon protein